MNLMQAELPSRCVLVLDGSAQRCADLNVIVQVCWSLKLVGGWGVVVGRAAAGLGGTAAWVIPPLLAVEVSAHPNTSPPPTASTLLQ